MAIFLYGSEKRAATKKIEALLRVTEKWMERIVPWAELVDWKINECIGEAIKIMNCVGDHNEEV